MYTLQNRSGSISIGEAFIKDRDIRTDDKDVAKILIKQANTVDLLTVLKHYNINLDEYNKKCICPFSFHANERTGSFTYYKATNSFFCFGCKSGGGPVNFVSLTDNISKYEAAKKISNKFYIDPNVVLRDTSHFVDRQNLHLEFSELVRNFIFDNLDDKQALEYCEKVSLIFDTINSRHNLDNIGLKSLLDKLKIKLKQYK
jgi:DNA primase